MAEGATSIVEKHYEEIALDKDDVPLDINWSELLAEEQRGNWGCFVGRYNGKVVTYIAWWFKRPYRYASTLYCHSDVFWMAPQHRKGLTGYRFLKAALEALPRPCKVQWGEKITFQDGRVGLLLARLGLKPTEVQYTGFLK